jgi:polysaccharide biosynthesis transport protein
MQPRGAVNELSLNAMLDVLKRRKNAVLIGMLLATACAALYALSSADQYRAEVLMSVEPAAAQDYLKNPDAAPPVNVQEKLWLIREHLFSPALLGRIIQEFHLYSNQSGAAPHWWAGLTKTVRETLRKTLRRWRLLGSPQPTEQERKAQQIELTQARIKIEVEAPDAFSIGFEGDNRTEVTAAANRIAELLVQDTARASEQRADSAAGFLETEVNRVKETLDAQKQRIQEFQQSATDQLPAELGTNLKMFETLEGQLLAKKEQIADDQARRAAVVEELKELANQGVLDAPAEPSPAEAKLEEMRARLKELQAKYTPLHPEVKATEAEIRDLERTATENSSKTPAEPSPAHLRYMQLKAEQEAIDRRLVSYQQQLDALAPQIADYRRKAQATPQHERTLADLTRDYDETRLQYQSLLDKQNRAQLEERLEQSTQSAMFRIVRPAPLPLEPFAPKRGRIVLLGLLAGLGLGLLFAIFAEYRDTTYRSVEDFRTSTSLPVLAMIPALPEAPDPASRGAALRQSSNSLTLRESAARPVQQVVTLRAPRSIASEQYGFLTLQIRHLLAGPTSQVVAVTSAAGGEGKTITSINLAVMLSRTAVGRVLLLECDLRKPRVHEYLGLKQGGGVSDLLQGTRETMFETYLRRVDELSILTGGSALTNPLELLSSGRTRALLAQLREAFQYIIVDLPPILPIADSQILAELSDGVILVVRAHQTCRELFQHALGRFALPNILGVVLNGVALERSSYAKAYEYYAQDYVGQAERRAVSSQ